MEPLKWNTVVTLPFSLALHLHLRMTPSPEEVTDVPDDEENHRAEYEDVENEVEEPVIDPPPSRGENSRDWILSTLDRPFFQALGLLVLFFVISSGALFFFFLMGWQTVCRPRTDCEPRNWWLNWAIQVLNVCFTYTAFISLPWRATNAIHTFGWGCPYRRNDVGYDLYGLPTQDIWFHVPLFRRGGILVILILNCVTQYANQATRIKYYSYDLADVSPGNIWTNVFFVSSFAFSGIGGAWLLYEYGKVRKAHPANTFDPGPVDMARIKYGEYKASREAAMKKNDGEKDDAEAIEEVAVLAKTDSVLHNPDPTREGKRRSLVPANRSSMRLFAM
jgi:hypothetical protein